MAPITLSPLRYHSLHGSTEKRVAALQGELQVVRFEKERTALVHQETLKDLKRLQLDHEKHHKKVIQHPPLPLLPSPIEGVMGGL